MLSKSVKEKRPPFVPNVKEASVFNARLEGMTRQLANFSRCASLTNTPLCLGGPLVPEKAAARVPRARTQSHVPQPMKGGLKYSRLAVPVTRFLYYATRQAAGTEPQAERMLARAPNGAAKGASSSLHRGPFKDITPVSTQEFRVTLFLA